MDTRWIEDFLSLCDTRSFTRSAELRGETQPAFSRHIRALEDALGARLFHRTSHVVELTAQGHAFLSTARDIVRLVNSSRRLLAGQEASRKQEVVFAASHTLASNFIGPWLREFVDDLSLPSYRLISGGYQDCVAALINLDCHFLICHFVEGRSSAVTGADFVSRKIRPSRLIAVSAPSGAGAPLFALDENVRGPLPVLAYERENSTLGFGVRRMLEARNPHLALQEKVTSTYPDVLRAMAVSGFGLAWLPDYTIENHLRNGSLVRASPPSWDVQTDIRMVRGRRRRLPRGAEAIWAKLGRMDTRSNKNH